MKPFSLEDARWANLQGGYRLQYNASVPLRALASGAAADDVWEELWNELHHQGDVGEASYAAVPALVEICVGRGLLDWNLFSIVSAIECCRSEGSNPALPSWLQVDYAEAWECLFGFGLEGLRRSNEPLLVQSILGFIALHKGLRQVGRMISELDASEIEELYANYFGGGA